MERIKYINNKELLLEIDRSKRTFSWFLQPKYERYDAIVHDIASITPELVDATLQKRLDLVVKQGPAVWGTALADGISSTDIVFRVMTNEHIPFDPTRKRRSKVASDEGQARTPFAPFKHYIMNTDGTLQEVGRSHWQGSLSNGHFSIEHGKITNRLATMFMLLVERYSKRGNWRGYCVDEKTEALTQRGWLSINEITESDTILSYNQDNANLIWSEIKSIFRDDFNGKMFKMTGSGIDALVTPGHRFVTERGFIRVEYLLDNDVIILSGNGSNDTMSDSRLAKIKVSNINFHGAKREGSLDDPNVPTVDYKGKVWCPETQYGCFIARRNGIVHLTSNTYNDEMRSHALLQLSQTCLLFDESKSDNPFAFYTQIIKNSFTRILIVERKNQHIRDDLLIMSGVQPSYTRQIDHEIEQRFENEKVNSGIDAEPSKAKVVELPVKRGRKPKNQQSKSD